MRHACICIVTATENISLQPIKPVAKLSNQLKQLRDYMKGQFHKCFTKYPIFLWCSIRSYNYAIAQTQ